MGRERVMFWSHGHRMDDHLTLVVATTETPMGMIVTYLHRGTVYEWMRQCEADAFASFFRQAS